MNTKFLSWYLAGFITTLVWGKNWVQGTFAISFSLQMILYILTIILSAKVYKWILED